MSGYLVPSGYGEAVFTEKRSKFTGRVWLCETEEEALAHIRDMRTQFWDASHNVYAYIIKEGSAGKAGAILRYSDDGEPKGTAGMPVLEVLRREEITNVLCVVTRYFGGVLLGAGGLTRAYAHSAKIGLDAAGISRMSPVDVFSLCCPYPLYEQLQREIAAANGTVETADYGADIRITCWMPSAASQGFIDRVRELSAGRILPEVAETRHVPVPLSNEP